MAEHKPWTRTASREVYRLDPWLSVSVDDYSLPDGRAVSGYHRVTWPDFAAMAVETVDGRFILTRQWKVGVGATSLILPGGMIDPGETPLAAAQRELMEETGYRAEDWRLLHRMVLQGNHRGCEAHIFYARDAVQVAEPDSGDLEEMEILLLDRDAVRQALLGHQIVLAASATALAMILAGIIPDATP